MSKAVIFFANGCEECEGLIVVDFLRRAKIDIKTVSIYDEPKVTSSHNVTFFTDAILADTDFSDTEIVILPGGIPGTPNLEANEKVCEIVKDFASKKKVAAICAAPGVFQRLGILNGKKATINPGCKDELPAEVFEEKRVVVDGNIITSRSVGTAMEFAIEIVRALQGDTAAEMLAKSTLTKI